MYVRVEFLFKYNKLIINNIFLQVYTSVDIQLFITITESIHEN